MCDMDNGLTSKIAFLVLGVLLAGEWRGFPFAVSEWLVAVAKGVAPPDVATIVRPPSVRSAFLKSLVETSPLLRLLLATMCLLDAAKYWLGSKLVRAYKAMFPVPLRQKYAWFAQGSVLALLAIADGLLWIVFGREAGFAAILCGAPMIAASVEDYLRAQFAAGLLAK
jgi:hypothetical protein